jgi:hypothetical protein
MHILNYLSFSFVNHNLSLIQTNYNISNITSLINSASDKNILRDIEIDNIQNLITNINTTIFNN